MLLRLVQQGLELLYRVETHLDVADFVIDSATRDAFGLGRAPREQLLVAEDGENLELALFVDEKVLANLARNDPRERLDERNLQDFLFTVEGVSHFVFFVWRTRRARPVSALELELQAEVDKYVTCLLTMWPQNGRPPNNLNEILFERFRLEPDLNSEERERYLVANANARAFAGSLYERFVKRIDLPGMLWELRRFYRLGAQEKLAHIKNAA
ncbi:MAG: hypothetical protein HY698_04080 [Deltaproteobacteria bacterium]|nr:hypothetical protein [Deltaproteobacteria bacterium]